MFRIICLFTCSCLFANTYVDISEQVVEYRLRDNQYAVIVVQDGIPLEVARQRARQRAAEVAFETGCRYYVVEREMQTEVIRSERPEKQGFFGDMYQELLIEEEFHKDRLSTDGTANEGRYAALRLVFSCHKEKPQGTAAIDICTLGQCP